MCLTFFFFFMWTSHHLFILSLSSFFKTPQCYNYPLMWKGVWIQDVSGGSFWFEVLVPLIVLCTAQTILNIGRLKDYNCFNQIKFNINIICYLMWENNQKKKLAPNSHIISTCISNINQYGKIHFFILKKVTVTQLFCVG